MTPTGPRIAGFRLRVAPATILTVIVMAAIVYPALARSVQDSSLAIATAVLLALVMVLCVLIHELAHALTARAFGGDVQEIALTLWGGHTTYRWGTIRPVASMLISLSGPAANIVLALLFSGAASLLREGLHSGQVVVSPFAVAALALIAYASILNWALALFNLLPGLPMDGGRAVESLLTALGTPAWTATTVTAWVGRVVAVAIVVIPLLRGLVAGQMPDLLVMIWALLIASFLFRGAGEALRESRLLRRSQGLSTEALMEPVGPWEPAASLETALAAAGPQRKGLLVGADGTVVLLDPDAVASVPPQQRGSVPASVVALSLGTAPAIRADLSGPDLLEAMVAADAAVFLVQRSDGRIIGAIRATSVNTALGLDH
ncbi:site-2 protease family protein [Helcobacillus massiliensis]|uniref:site-2 protease family protein n=1 Tax=Helcobacillus massiliensis TaxID=521392 RepID=UPI00255413BD|nr:site-2 protease family protein [Helcobacillus massiliensis]MDK7741153.1 peptidase [Helcobacillus massiliensis]WOO93960.1 peptidase [Helcobacillus massiliensis]